MHLAIASIISFNGVAHCLVLLGPCIFSWKTLLCLVDMGLGEEGCASEAREGGGGGRGKVSYTLSLAAWEANRT